MNGILGQQVPERKALFGPGRPVPGKQVGTAQQQYSQQQATPTTVHRVHTVPNKHPEPVCILGCCGFGKISVLWTVSSAMLQENGLIFFENVEEKVKEKEKLKDVVSQCFNWFLYSNEFRELSRHYDVIVEPNHLKSNVFS